jgi:DNA-binding beta-propeller fold protein YncE
MRKSLALVLLGCASLSAQQTPAPTDLLGKPFFVKKSWVIGGEGRWDYVVLDPVRLQLFIAHGAVVQIVDVSSGTIFGTISLTQGASGQFRSPIAHLAQGIALDDSGAFGYITDAKEQCVKVFDRSTLEIVATVPVGVNPRAIVFDPVSRLVLAASEVPEAKTAAAGSGNRTPAGKQAAKPAASGGVAAQQAGATVTVIDADKHQILANILLRNRLGFGQGDGNGGVYFAVPAKGTVLRLDAEAIGKQLRNPSLYVSERESNTPVTLDWAGHESGGGLLRVFGLGPGCVDPNGLAIDELHLRLFASCAERRMAVVDSLSGQFVTSLPISFGSSSIAYDAGRGLIYTANASGNLIIIRRDVNDSYAIVQNLPTAQNAWALAANPTTGEVYLVTEDYGVDPAKIGTPNLQIEPQKGSFKVLVVGN